MQLVGRRGKKRVEIAAGHSLPMILYHTLKQRNPDTELGGDSFEHLQPDQLTRYYIERLRVLGYTVTLQRGAALWSKF